MLAVTSPLSYTLMSGQGSYLKANGFDRVIFVSGYSEETRRWVEKEGMAFESLEMKREISLLSDLGAIIKAIRLLRQHKPDVLNASTPKAGLVFMLASLFVPAVYPIFTLRGLRSDTLTGFSRLIVTITEYISCLIAKKVIVISPSLLDHAIRRKIIGRKKAVVFGRGSSNGLDLNKFNVTPENIEKGKAFRLRYNIPHEGCVFGFVGRIVRDKGVTEMFEAFDMLAKDKSDVYLVLVGPVEESDPVSEETLKRMKGHKRVFFVDFQKDVPAVLSALDVLILYSYREGFGNVTIQASAMHLPVIVSDIPGARDGVLNNETGILVPPRDVTSLFDAMKYYSDTPIIRHRHGQNGRRYVEGWFSSEFIWRQQALLYRSCLR